jgi:CubicO group peptidase (beta-lactamase class C family)
MKPLSIAVLLLAYVPATAAYLPRAVPESQGVRSAAILEFIEAADKSVDSLHSVMIVRHGNVVAEGWWAPYAAGTRHSLFSLSKSFTSTAVGIAAEEGKLSADDPVLKFFPDDAPAEPSANLKAMRLTDLLRMSTGQQSEPPRTAKEAWTKTFLAQPVPFKPGTHFLYNTSATYMCSAAVQKATGQTVLDYLKPRLFDPLGIENPTWEASPQGISTGGYGLSVRTEDIAKFGQLYLQKGKWNGKELVPAAWVEAATATARQTSNGSNPKSDWDQGYGYQFWRCRHGAYRGDGAFGQYCIVLPEQDAVIAITGGLRDMQAVLNLVWEKLLPGFTAGKLEADEASVAKLNARLKGLTIPVPVKFKGKVPDVVAHEYEFPANELNLSSVHLEATSLGFEFGDVHSAVSLQENVWTPCKKTIAWGRLPAQPAAACGNWTSADTFTLKLCFVETPFIVTIRMKFSDGAVKLESETNVGFGATKAAPLTGKKK